MDKLQLEQTYKQIKSAWIIGAISTVITLIFSLIGSYNDTFRYEKGYDTWSLLDVAFMAGLTYGIYKQNRYCALGFLVYFIFSKFLMVIATGQFTGGLISILFAYFLFQGTRAAFRLHRHLIETGEIVVEEKRKGVLFYIGVSFASILALILISIITIGFFSPEIETIPGKQINKKYTSFVREQGLVEPLEEIQYWYSDGLGDFKSSFYLFTDKKVVIYNKEWEEPAIVVPFNQITDIEFEHDPSFFEDSRITLYLDDNSTLYFPVSSENGGDRKYYERLVEAWNLSTDVLE